MRVYAFEKCSFILITNFRCGHNKISFRLKTKSKFSVLQLQVRLGLSLPHNYNLVSLHNVSIDTSDERLRTLSEGSKGGTVSCKVYTQSTHSCFSERERGEEFETERGRSGLSYPSPKARPASVRGSRRRTKHRSRNSASSPSLQVLQLCRSPG